MKLQVRQFFGALPLLLPLVLESGCATNALWKNDNLEAWNEPANTVNLRLFDAKQRHDLLVVYNEYSERKGAAQTRAYWLNENQMRVSQRNAPIFVNKNSAINLPAVPVFYSLPNDTTIPGKLYALVETNQQSFALFSDNRKIGAYDFPVYNDGTGKLKKAFFTPVAVTADITIVGGMIGYLYLAGWADGYNRSY